MLKVNMPKAYNIEYLDVPIPDIEENEMIIKMERLGICGSDIQVYHGKHNYMSFPVVQGHEGSGVIYQMGNKVEDFSIGDKVTIQPQIFCGKCYPCTIGKINVCKNLKVYGVHTNGLATEYFNVDASKVIKIPENITFDEGAMIEPTAVAVHAAKKCGDVNGGNILVFGAGTIGNLVAQVIKAMGAKNVMVADINKKRLELAQDCNIDYCINNKESNLKFELDKAFGERGADAIIDCAAVKPTILEAIELARNASKIVVVGNFKEKIEIEMPMLQRREIDMIGVMMYLREDYEDAIDLISKGKIQVKKLISNYFNIREFHEAYSFIDKNPNDVMKVMLKFNE